MSLTFKTQIELGFFSETKLEVLITRLNCLGFTIIGVIVGDFAEDNDIYDQQKALYCPKSIIKKILLASTSEASFFMEDIKQIRLSMNYYDTPVYLSLFLETKTNQLSLSFRYLDWKRNFEHASENRMYDNGRYARLFINVIEPLVLQDLTIKCDYEYLDEELPENCLAVAISTFDFDKFITTIMNNIIFSNCSIVINTKDMYLPKIDAIKNYFINHEPVEVFLKAKEEIIAKLVIAYERDQLFLFPLEPYQMKTFDDEHGIDLQFYLQLLLNICNHYPIWELKTNFK